MSALTAGFGGDKDALLAFGKVAETAGLALNGRGTAFTDFLDPLKVKRVQDAFGEDCCRAFGGVAFSERCVVGFCSDYLDADFALGEDRFPIARLKITPRQRGVLAHKDYLGALCSAAGRESVGDLFVSDMAAYALVKSDVADDILYGLSSVGRCAVTCESVDFVEFGGVFAPDTATAFAASRRVDGVLAKCLNMSRGDVSDAIRAERAFVNWVVCRSVSEPVAEGDTLTVRGTGRIKILSLSETSKERVKIDFLRWK